MGKRQMSPLYRRCIESQLEAFPDYTHELIDDEKALLLLQSANKLYDGVNTVDEYMKLPFITPDYLRCFFLSLNSDTLYCDCDVFMENKGFPPLSPDQPAMERIAHTKIYNSGIIWNGARTDIFDEASRYWFGQKGIAFINGAMNKLAVQNDFQPLETGFIHYMIGCWFGYNEKKIFDEEGVPDRLLTKGFSNG